MGNGRCKRYSRVFGPVPNPAFVAFGIEVDRQVLACKLSKEHLGQERSWLSKWGPNYSNHCLTFL
jgi:hypothetical protein